MYDDYFDNPYEWNDPDVNPYTGTYQPAWAQPFANPGGRSALKAETAKNPRNLPCPTCNQPNRLTPADQQLGYQCNDCADRDEGRMW